MTPHEPTCPLSDIPGSLDPSAANDVKCICRPKPAFDVEAEARGLLFLIKSNYYSTDEWLYPRVKFVLTAAHEAGVATRISPEDYIAAIKETQKEAFEAGKREPNAAWVANEANQNADIDGSYHCACAVDDDGKLLQECCFHIDRFKAGKREGRVEGMKECEAELHQKVATVGPSAFLRAFKVVAALVAKEASR